MDIKLCPCDPILGYIISTSTMLPENAVRNSWTKGSPCNSKCPCMSVNCPWFYVVLSTLRCLGSRSALLLRGVKYFKLEMQLPGRRSAVADEKSN